MTERNYYCLVAGLPDLVADERKMAFSSVQFRERLKEDLHPADYELAKMFYLPYDHKNLLNLLLAKDEEWDERGNFSRDDMEPVADKKSFELADLSLFPKYIAAFIDRYYGEEGVESYFQGEMLLTEGYFSHFERCKNRFVRDVAIHERNIGNIMNALNGRKFELPFEANLMGDDAITAALAKSRARDFGLSTDVDYIETLVQIFETENLLDREFKLDLYRWNSLEEMTFFNYFTIEKVLAFLLKLFIVERWFLLDKEKGQEMFSKILNEIKSEFQFPDEFTLAYGKKK